MWQASRRMVVAALAMLVLFAVSVPAQAASGKGAVKSVDAEGKKLVVTAGTKKASSEVEYAVADDVKITLNKKEAKLEELEEGDKVTVTFEDKEGVKTVSKIVALRAKKKE